MYSKKLTDRTWQTHWWSKIRQLSFCWDLPWFLFASVSLLPAGLFLVRPDVAISPALIWKKSCTGGLCHHWLVFMDSSGLGFFIDVDKWQLSADKPSFLLANDVHVTTRHHLIQSYTSGGTLNIPMCFCLRLIWGGFSGVYHYTNNVFVAMLPSPPRATATKQQTWDTRSNKPSQT